jgi:glutathione S-transferase
MLDPVLIVGSYLSPYVRKVLVCLETKGVAYEIDPIVPFLGDERFSKLSPLRRVPVYRDERVTFADSSVICQYPEDRRSTPPSSASGSTPRAGRRPRSSWSARSPARDSGGSRASRT